MTKALRAITEFIIL